MHGPGYHKGNWNKYDVRMGGVGDKGKRTFDAHYKK